MATTIPDNRVELTLTEIARATGAEVRPGAGDLVRGVTTDSRGDVAGKLFVALSGEHFDGHAFVGDAVRAGARAVMISRDVEVPATVAAVRVPDTLAALGSLARLHRRRWGGRLVAVAGSAGKTTTKNAVAAGLRAAVPGAVHAVRGNLNNLIGVPMVLFGLGPEHRAAVVEIGTNTRGEVARLAAVSEPDVGVLTLIAIEHSAGIGDLDAIEAEEGELLAGLGSAATAIGNADDPRVRRQLGRSGASVQLGYGVARDADYRIVERGSRGLGGSGLVIERPVDGGRERVRVETGLLGLPGALAVAAGLCVADRIGGRPVAAEPFQRALAEVGAGEPGRLDPIELADGTVVIDDTYNANPASVLGAVATVRELAVERGGRWVLVIGEMRELGELSIREHAALGEALAKSGAALLIAVEGHAEHLARAARDHGLEAVFVPDADAAASLVVDRVATGDLVLVKASRGVRAERIVDALVRARGRAA